MDPKRVGGSGGGRGSSIQMYSKICLSERTDTTRFIMMLGASPLQIF